MKSRHHVGIILHRSKQNYEPNRYCAVSTTMRQIEDISELEAAFGTYLKNVYFFFTLHNLSDNFLLYIKLVYT